MTCIFYVSTALNGLHLQFLIHSSIGYYRRFIHNPCFL